MSKLTKIIVCIFSILILMRYETQALGGDDVVNISPDECQQKGLVSIQSEDGNLFSATLYKEGKGQLGFCTGSSAEQINAEEKLTKKSHTLILAIKKLKLLNFL